MSNFDSIFDIIKNNDSFILTTHINPDGDAIGSELALARFLKSEGKQVKIINHSSTPEYLKFIVNDDDEIELFESSLYEDIIDQADVIFMLDINQLNRTGDLENSIRMSKAKKICIDHHEFPESFADAEVIDTEKSSTGELVYDLLSEAKIKLDFDIALPLYIAILTDTGSFKYDRTTPRVHRIVAELLETGIDTKTVYREIYDQGTANRIQLLGRALSSLTVVCKGKVSYMMVKRSDLAETGTTEEDVEGFVNYNLTIRGVEVGIFFFELEDGVKASFRSVSKVPVNKLAKEFNGGGHFHAAGARITGQKLELSIREVLEKTEIYITEYL